MSAESLNTLGYYGTVPIHDDFISRGLPRSFIDPWNLWLQEAIAASRQQLGKDWPNFYLASPLYHFALSPGICGENGWMGVLMPSADRTGRYFPMTIALMVGEDINPFIAMQKTEWFAKIEAIAFSCRHDGCQLDELNRAIDQLSQDIGTIPSDTLCITERMSHKAFHATWRQPLDGIGSMADLLPLLLDDIIKERCFAYSLWWTEGSGLIPASFFFSEGLPPIDSVAALFDGNWQKWGWQENSRTGQFPSPSSKPSSNE